MFLGLLEPLLFTGHSFHRSSAFWLADASGDKDTIMQLGGWKSSTVAENYVESSVESKKRVAERILGDSTEPSAKTI
jgi:integrase